jgi:hypothetical protein
VLRDHHAAMTPVPTAELLSGQPPGDAPDLSGHGHAKASRRAKNFELVCSAALGALVATALVFSSITSLRAQVPTSLPWASATVKDGPLSAEFQREVLPRLTLPPSEVAAYAVRLQGALDAARIALEPPQFIALVDRNPNVQALLLFWGPATHGWEYVGAAPVSTGLPGRYEHFTTPLGVFDHSMANPDFRAEGTKNKLGFRGYGRKGMRVYDFGWVQAPRGWGSGAMGTLRLQMHATDPELAAQKLGTAQSEGCVRIPATLNAFIDLHGLLDEDYDRQSASGVHLWVLRPDRMPSRTPGRYLVVVDSNLQQRPDWSPLPSGH